MTIDNFNIVTSWFDNLSDQGDFYFVQIIQRKKECNIGSNNNVIKDYHFFDTSLSVCIERDKNRDVQVSEKIIRNFYNNYKDIYPLNGR